MRRLIITALLAASLCGSAFADTHEDNVRTVTQAGETRDGAKIIFENFYKSAGFDVTLIEWSAFTPKTLRGVHYLVAKVLISAHQAGHTFQHVSGIVIDLDAPDFAQYALPEDSFRTFVRTGDRSILPIPNLDPNS